MERLPGDEPLSDELLLAMIVDDLQELSNPLTREEIAAGLGLSLGDTQTSSTKVGIGARFRAFFKGQSESESALQRLDALLVIGVRSGFLLEVARGERVLFSPTPVGIAWSVKTFEQWGRDAFLTEDGALLALTEICEVLLAVGGLPERELFKIWSDDRAVDPDGSGSLAEGALHHAIRRDEPILFQRALQLGQEFGWIELTRGSISLTTEGRMETGKR